MTPVTLTTEFRWQLRSNFRPQYVRRTESSGAPKRGQPQDWRHRSMLKEHAKAPYQGPGISN
jgi:hypothetical protein